MPWPVYSERLLASSVQNTWVAFMVPVGMRAIVKSVVVANGLAQEATVHVTVGNYYALLRTFPAAVSTYAIDMHAVAYGGEAIQLVNIGSSASTRVDGYLLTDTQAREGPPESATSLPAPRPLPPVPSPSS